MIKKIVPISSIVLLTLLFIYCTTDESTIIGPFGNAGKYITVLDFFADKETVYSKGDTSIVSLKVLNIDNSPTIGLKVNFTTQFGSITESDTTDSSGVARAIFVSDENTGTNIITINTGIKEYTLTIDVVNYQPAVIELSSESAVILADGVSTTTITAVVKDSLGSPMEKMTLKFHTTLGKLSVTLGQTDKDGSIQTVLTSSDTIDTAIITAESGIEKSINVKFHMDVPAYLELSAENPVLLADGVSTTTITAIVKDSSGHRMGGEPVIFKTTRGKLSEEGAISTDSDGVAKVALTSSIDPGTALIIATSFVSDSVEVEFNINVPERIDLYATPTVILADGESYSTITAIPKDIDGNIMPGLTVHFSTTLGELSETVMKTGADGKAETILTSGTINGTAIVTATSSTESTVGVEFIAYNPAIIELTKEEESILADGFSEVTIIAKVLDSVGNSLPGAVVDFSTNAGSLSKTTGVIVNQEGKAVVILRSVGSTEDIDATVTAIVQGTELSETLLVTFRGISMTTYVDSLQFSSGGYYNAFIRTELIETSNGRVIEEAAVRFNSTIGEMRPPVDGTNEFGRTFSILYADVTGADQSGLVITTELSNAPEISKQTDSRVIPGVEALISTIDDDVMGDGEGWALVKATLRETTGNKAITGVGIDWATTLGTIIGRSKTNSTGHTIDTLRIENSVSTNTDVTITANFGDNISISDIVKFIPPVNSNRLIMGFEADMTAHDTVLCDNPQEFAVRDVGVSVLYVNADSNPIGGETINFRIVPNYFAAICPTEVTVGDLNGIAIVMLAYPPQHGGEIVRVWAEAPDGTRGSIDVILPKVEEEEDDSGGG